MGISNKVKSKFKSLGLKSQWVFHYDGSGCDGCNAEYLGLFSPVWDVERLGIRNTGNPSYADILVVTGLIDELNKDELIDIYNQLPKGSKVVAIGGCACTGSLFAECQGVLAGVDTVIPVDYYVAGCSTRPEAIIDALMMAQEGGTDDEH